MSEDRAQKAALVRKQKIQEALLDDRVIGLATDVSDYVIDSLIEAGAKGGADKLSLVALQAIFMLVREKLDSRIVRAARGRTRSPRTFLTPVTTVTFGTDVRFTQKGTEQTGKFIGWAKGNRREKGFARVSIGDDAIVTARIFLPAKVETETA
jgi:hypothetical protein